MTSLEQLKQELLSQKSAIIAKGGVVTTAHANPSPAEITAGINNIPILDMSNATATTADVLKGKTFYAVDKTLKTGTLEILDEETYEILHNNYYTPAKTRQLDYYIPTGTLKLRPYYMAYNPSYINIYLNDELEEFGEHAFDNCANFNLTNFTSMQNLTTIGNYGLCRTGNLDLTNIPACITHIGDYSFAESFYNNRVVKIPATIQSAGIYCFSGLESTVRLRIDQIDLTESTLQTLSTGMFQNVVANCDLIIPSSVTKISNFFNYYGSVKSVTIPSSVDSLGMYCFGCPTSQAVEDNLLKNIYINRETPPSTEYQPFGPPGARTETKIYVPDQSLEAYKAHAKLSAYKDIMYPMSQME